MFDVERFRDGDRAYFDDVIDQYGRLVMHVVASFALDGDHAADLHQEVWIQVYETAVRYSGSGSIDAWIHRVAANVCVSDYRSRKAEGVRRRRFALEADMADGSGWHAPNPADAAIRAEELETLRRAMKALPPKQRQTVTLMLADGLSAAEVADVMGISDATVRSNTRHAIKRLRIIIEEGPGEDLPRHQSPN